MDPFQEQLEWSRGAARVARHAVGDWLDQVGCDDDAREDVVLAASELVTRAVNDCAGPPTLHASLGDGRVLLRIDSTEALAPDDVIDPLRQLSARVLQAVCCSWGVDARGGSTVLWAEVPRPRGHAGRRHPGGWCTRHTRFDRPSPG
jgi:hypothetical protein